MIFTGGDFLFIKGEIGHFLERFIYHFVVTNNKMEEGTKCENIGDKIYNFFKTSQYNFASVEGLSRKLNADGSIINDILNKDERFRKSYFRTRNQQPTYTLSSKKMSFTEKLSQLLAVAATQFDPNYS